MMYRVCPYCGSHLDPGERCDCAKEQERRTDREQDAAAGAGSGVVNHALYAGAKVMKQEQAQAMKDYKLKDTGDLIKSIKSGKIRKTDTGKMITVGPDGVDRKGVRNMEKAAIAQYGSSREPARPWATLARVRGENKVRERMAEVFREEISKAGGEEE